MNSVRQRCQDGRLPSREALVDFCDRQERHLWILHTFVAPESQVRVQLKYSIITLINWLVKREVLYRATAFTHYAKGSPGELLRRQLLNRVSVCVCIYASNREKVYRITPTHTLSLTHAYIPYMQTHTQRERERKERERMATWQKSDASSVIAVPVRFLCTRNGKWALGIDVDQQHTNEYIFY